ncbi:MAG TPA: hypothetical protein VFE14_05775, partial [Micromonosporaceae bacterium]|nr:hypothetical protein [Micromonosporaceae bacterium]
NALGRARFNWGVQTARRRTPAGTSPLAATAATLVDPLSHLTMNRVGAGLVGIDPTGTTRLRPAMTLTAPLGASAPGLRWHRGRLWPHVVGAVPDRA